MGGGCPRPRSLGVPCVPRGQASSAPSGCEQLWPPLQVPAAERGILVSSRPVHVLRPVPDGCGASAPPPTRGSWAAHSGRAVWGQHRPAPDPFPTLRPASCAAGQRGGRQLVPGVETGAALYPLGPGFKSWSPLLGCVLGPTPAPAPVSSAVKGGFWQPPPGGWLKTERSEGTQSSQPSIWR